MTSDKDLVVEKDITVKIDNVITLLLVSVFVLSPFAVQKFSPMLMQLNKGLYYLAFVLILASLHLKKISKIDLMIIGLVFGLIGLWLMGLIFDYFRVDLVMVFYKYFQFISLVFIALWARKLTCAIKEKCAGLLFVVVTFYCLDAIYGSFYGVDFFGFEVMRTHGTESASRSWGAFAYGAPPFGVVVCAFFTFGWFYLKSRNIRIVYYFVLTSALVLTQDRSAIVQVIASLFVMAIVLGRSKYFIILGAVAVLVLDRWFSDADIFFRMRLLIDGFEFYVKSGWIALQGEGGQFSLSSYLSKWFIILQHIVDEMVSYRYLWGVGWGMSDWYLGYNTALVGRAHSNWIQYAIEFGAVFSIISAFMVFYYLRRVNTHSFIVFLPITMPFLVNTYTSFNFSILIALLLIVSPSANRIVARV